MRFKKMEDPWESISDLMTGLMMVFLFVTMAYIVIQKDMVYRYEQVRSEIYNELSEEFPQDEIKGMGAHIDASSMAIVFDDKDLCFEKGSAQLTPKYQAMLNNFFPRYIKVLENSKYKDEISEVLIEGHASREWNGDANSDVAYFYNMKLSQDRAMNVLQYTYNIPALQDKKEWLREHVSATGLSYKKAQDASGTSDRRVEFSVRTTSEELMNQRWRELFGGKKDTE